MLEQIRRVGGFVRRRFRPQRSPAEGRVDPAAPSAGKDSLYTYTEHTDRRVDEDPHTAIGGLWEEIGALQFEYVKRSGLAPRHRLLDIGCGTLRGGRHFIRYLDAGGYTGIDLSPKAIAAARRLVAEEGLADRAPTLLVNATKTLRFAEFADAAFDFALAQSVFTHLKPEHVEECFAHVGRVLAPGGSLHFTYFPSATGAFEEKTVKDFAYPLEFFQELAARFGLRVDDRAAQYPHPRGQRMARLSAGGA